MRVRRFLHVLLLFVVGVLAQQVVVTWSWPVPQLGSASQGGVEIEKPLPPLPVLTPQTGRRLAEVIADKDLFSPSRSRAVKETTPVATVAPPSHLKLVGVVLSADREEAFFADSTQGGKVVRVRKGESLGSYQLAGVTPLQATLTLGQGGEQVNLPLLVLDSGAAAKGQHLMPALPRPGVAAVQPRQARPGVAPALASGPGRAAVPPPQNEAQAIRQNIRQLQQRLRQIRRHAALEAASEAKEEEGQQEGEEEEEE